MTHTNDEAVNRLIEDNIRLVYAAAKRFSFAERDEIVQSGCLGLTYAARRFDASRGAAFSTFAVPYILGEIKAFLRRDRAVHVPRQVQDLGVRARRESARLCMVLSREPTILEIAESLGVLAEDIIASLEAQSPAVSLDSAASGDDDAQLSNLIVDDSAILPMERVLVRDMVENLQEKEREIVKLRYFDGKTQSDTAKIMGLGQPQICRLEKAVLIKLRELAG